MQLSIYSCNTAVQTHYGSGQEGNCEGIKKNIFVVICQLASCLVAAEYYCKHIIKKLHSVCTVIREEL